jgi:branched-chain amino acid transport system substrate-binding protein
VRTAAALVALLAMIAACGSRLPGDELARLDAQAAGTGRAATPSSGDGGGSSDAGSAGAGADSSAATDAGLPASTDSGATTGGGTAGGGTGSGPAGGAEGAADADCHGGATAKGVTPTEIKVGAIVSASGPLPGATEGSYRGAQAYLTKVNAAGGVCGRKITLLKGDDGLDPQRARSEFLRLEPQTFAMVGGYSVADSGFADLVQSTQVPYVGVIVDPAGRGPTFFPKVPVNASNTGLYQYYRNAYPNVSKMAFLYADVGGVRANAPTGRESLKKVGFQLVYDSGLSAISPDYTSDVITMRDRGAQGVYLFAFELNMHVRIARAMRQQNYEPPLKIAQIGYNSKLIELLGDTANGWTSHLDHLPMLTEGEAAKSPALADFLTWNQRVAPGAQLDLFPVAGWANAALFVEALRSLGPDVTRPRLVEALRKIQRFDGAGILTPRSPNGGEPGGCFVVVRVKDRRWVREHPDTGFDCSLGVPFHFG